MKRLALLPFLILFLVTVPTRAEVVQEGGAYTFKLDVSTWTDRPRAVSVAGDFNGWSATATPLSDPDGDNVWTGTVEEGLSEGKHLYKFVIDGGRWISDPTGDKELEEDDNYGGKNSGFIVGPDIRKAPPPKPDQIAAQFVMHDPSKLEDATVVDEAKVRLRLRTQAGDVEKVEVIPVKGPGEGTPVPLEKVESARGVDVFVGTVDFGDMITDLESEEFQAASGAVAEIAKDVHGIGDGASPEWPTRHIAHYRFRLTDGSAQVISERRDDPSTPDLDEASPHGVFMHTLDIPDWAKHAVWYQIFTERFRNGNPENDPGYYSDYETLIPWNANWWQAQAGEAPGEENFYQGAGNVWNRRYGGDIQGIREKLPYLRELGVNALYLNPIFEAESMHKYDTADFRHVDDNFGVMEGNREGATTRSGHEGAGRAYPYRVEGETADPATWGWSESDKLFLDFVEEAHAQGFKVIIDGVFNHVGRAHPFFMDVLEKGKESEFADWFEITDWGDPANWRAMEDPFEVHGKPGGIQWAAWDRANGHLPVFKKDAKLGLAPGPREHIFAITKRWTDPDGDPATRDGVDGWRLDVPGDIPHPFWKDWRKVVKEANPEAYITGEIWNWAQPWLQGDQFDAVMNYQFAMAAQDFFVDQRTAIEPSTFNDRLLQIVQAYPWPITLAQQNLFDSHDTDRLASMFVNPDRPYDGANRPQDNAQHFDGPAYSPRKPTQEEWERFKQAITLQHAFVGAPMTYYGNEAGMWSPDDPSNRQPFPWPDKGPYRQPGVGFNEEIFDHFQRVIAIRNALPALQSGEFVPVLVDDERDLYAFARTLDGQTVYLVLNRSNSQQTVDLEVEPGHYVDFMDERRVRLNFNGRSDTARPSLMPIGQPRASNGETLSVSLESYGTAVLVGRN